MRVQAREVLPQHSVSHRGPPPNLDIERRIVLCRPNRKVRLVAQRQDDRRLVAASDGFEGCAREQAGSPVSRVEAAGGEKGIDCAEMIACLFQRGTQTEMQFRIRRTRCNADLKRSNCVGIALLPKRDGAKERTSVDVTWVSQQDAGEHGVCVTKSAVLDKLQRTPEKVTV